MRKIIFSRKGFDSSFGGSPSPILEDGTIVSFPIPANTTCNDYDIRFKHLKPMGIDLGKLIDDLAVPTKRRKDHQIQDTGKIGSNDLAHLDPDICYSAFPDRKVGWRGLFGQCAAAQGHLRNQEVREGDLFLFYGLYRKVLLINGHYEYNRMSRPIHLIWGWMQIDDIVDIKGEQDAKAFKYPWAKYHPHYCFEKHPKNNTIYVAKEHLDIEDTNLKDVKGYGVFEIYDEQLQLTDPDYDKTSYWRLPDWMYTQDKPCSISYNAKREWKLENGYARLKAYTRGQEYVYDCQGKRQVKEWLNKLFDKYNQLK